MTKPDIYINEPCHENIGAMPKCEKGLYCGSCRKHVLDLRKKNLDEVHQVLEKNPGACIVLDARHVKGVKTWAWAERLAGFLKGYRFARTAAILLGVCLFLSSCHRRRLAGAYSAYNYKQSPNTQEKTEKI